MSTTTLSVVLEVIDKGSKELDQFQKNIAKTETSLKSFATGVAAIGAAMSVAAVGGLAAITKGAIDTADKLDETAQKVGVGVEALSALQYAAKMSGVEAETLNTGLKKISQSISEAQNPASEAANAFKALGISVKDSDGKLKSADTVLKEMAKRFAEAPDGVNKTAIAMQIAGKSGAELIPLLNQGADGIAKLTEEAAKLGIVIDEQTAKAAGDFNDQLDKIGTVTQAVGLQIAKNMLPTLQYLADEFINAKKSGGELEQFSLGLAEVFKLVVKTASYVVTAIAGIGTGIGALVAAVVQAAQGDFKGAVNIMKDWAVQAEKQVEAGKKFRAGLDETAKSTTAVKKATEESNKETKKDIEYKAGQAAAAEKLAKEFDRVVEGLMKESSAFANLSKVQEVSRQITDGAYAKFDNQQKEKLLALAAEIDTRRQLAQLLEAERAGAESGGSLLRTFKSMITDTQEGAAKLRIELESLQSEGGEAAAAVSAAINSINPARRLFDISNDLAMVAERIRVVRASMEAGGDDVTQGARKKYLEDQIKIQTALLTEQQVLRDSADIIRQMSIEMGTSAIEARNLQMETDAFKRHVSDSRGSLERIAFEAEKAAEWLDAGKISAAEFKRIMENLSTEKLEVIRGNLTQFDQEVNRIAKSFQDYLGNTFYDMMQGQFDMTLSGFKKMLDRMVAEALARNVANMIFGSGFSRSGMVSSDAPAAGLLQGLVSLLGFRAEGGPVQAGMPYIVGEKRAELFIPDTNGTILPSVDAGFSGGNNVTFQITAMDSQDVLRAMDKIKRPLAEMMNGTNRTYNLGAR